MRVRVTKLIRVVSVATLVAMVNVIVRMRNPSSHPVVQNSPIPYESISSKSVLQNTGLKDIGLPPGRSPNFNPLLKGQPLSFFDVRKRHPHLNNSQVVSYPMYPVRFPMKLKDLDPDEWSEQDKKWLNVTHYLWFQPLQCVNYTVKFAAPHSLPVTGLASFPNSGNSWVRYLIEGATGIFTGSMYKDIVLARTGMYGEFVPYDSGMTILQKSHGFTTKLVNTSKELSIDITKNHMKELNCSTILIIRDPFKALVGHRHLDVGGHKGFAPPQHFTGEGWNSFVEIKAAFWEAFYTFWIKSCPAETISVIHFEEIISNPLKELKKMLNFLNFTPDFKRIECLTKNLEGRMKRKTFIHRKKNVYTSMQKEILFRAIYNLNNVLNHTGLPLLPVRLYDYNDDYKMFLDNINYL